MMDAVDESLKDQPRQRDNELGVALAREDA